MKNSLFTLFLILLIKSNLCAQTITLLSDFDGTPYISEEEIIFKSGTHVATISGQIESDIAISVKTFGTDIIFIRASEAVFAANPNGGSKGTVIRPKPGVSCSPCFKKTAVKPKIDVLINQGNSNLQIISSAGVIIGYTLYDLTGKTITTEKTLPTNNYTIVTTELKKSIYILKIDLDNQQYKTLKFIKN